MTAPRPRQDTPVECPCGWVSTACTPGHARKALRTHSCERYAALKARAARVAARRADPGTVRPCEHKTARHEHGTRNAYILDRCRCAPCRGAQRDYNAALARHKMYGRPPRLIDAAPARDHVRDLMAHGMGWKRIAAASGVSPNTVNCLLYGKHNGQQSQSPRKRIDRDAAARLLAVTLDLAPGTFIPADPTRQLLRGLIAHGYSKADLRRATGWSYSALQMDRATISVAHAAEVQRLADRLAGTPGTSTRARRYAAARGWTVDLLWSDLAGDTTDVPVSAGAVDQVLLELAQAGEHLGGLSLKDRRAVVADLTTRGVPASKIAAQLGVAARTVVRYRRAS